VELEMPPKKEKVVYTKLTELQLQYYRAIKSKTLPDLLSPFAYQQLKNKGSSLQNMLMQLRKCCNHPYLFQWPLDKEGEEIIDETLVQQSGKLQLLDRLLPRLQEEGHRMLIFSQFTKTLDIVEDYLSFREYSFCRIDGTTPQVEREESIAKFNTDREISCFLLSTRAGGLGINLATADTVIFFDSDWNPQMDLQAQDRCHRIGQTKPVRIYRLATANSVESRILARANAKLKLDRLVIQKGNFVGVRSKSKGITESDLAEILKEHDGLAGVAEDITDEQLFQWD